MSDFIIISDSENEKLRPLLVSLAKRNEILAKQYQKHLDINVWAANVGEYSDDFLSTLCLVCGTLIKSKTLVITDHAYNVRYHGLCHLRDKGLLHFL